MKKVLINLLVIFVAAGLLPWVAFFIGHVSLRVSVISHVVGLIAVVLMKIYDALKGRKGMDK